MVQSRFEGGLKMRDKEVRVYVDFIDESKVYKWLTCHFGMIRDS